MSQEINRVFEVGDRVIMSYPTENKGASHDPITKLGLLDFFEDMNGKEFVIRSRTFDVYLNKENNNYQYRYIYRLSGMFTTARGVVRNPGSYWYEGYWLNPVNEMEDDKEVKFF